jgi:hypothetical protein
MAYAPSAIRSAATTITGGIGGAVFSGVVGDAAHSYGYHLARNQLPGSDYSVQLAADREGNGDAASALDISLPPDQMIAVTARLRAAAKAGDPRLYALREFAGTLDGRTTFNRDLSNATEGFGNWDDSHLWHIHLSGYRRYADDADAWRAIADVFTDAPSLGGALSAPAPTVQEDDDMQLIQGDTRGIALVGPGYFRHLNDDEEVAIATKMYGDPKVRDDRGYDVAKALALGGRPDDTQIAAIEREDAK